MTNKIKIKLQGHEKFPLREGWVNKALYLLPKYSDAFTRKDATDIFGIGSNMVKSLKYWMRAMGLTNMSGTELSEIGKLIADNDPYLEKMFTLWLIHSFIAKNVEDATTWYMFFNRCDVDGLEKGEIESILFREVKKYAEGISFSEKSLDNDIDVILNMYCVNREKNDPEEKNVSPLAQLDLIKMTEGKYFKCRPNKKKLADDIVLYELALKLLDKEAISIEEVVDGENGLAKIYNLSAVMANDYFDRLDSSGYIRVDRTAGLDMIYPTQKLEPMSILRNYYEKNQLEK